MNEEQFSRTELLIGKSAIEKLHRSSVIVFGIGGVGGYAAEALCRSGVGSLTLVDPDTVSVSNLNRQIVATYQTLNQLKAEMMAERLLSINPQASVFSIPKFYQAENAEKFPLDSYDYVIDCIDTVSSKLLLVQNAEKAGTPIISSMGAGNKLDPTAFRVGDIYETKVCPLARVMRRELRQRGIASLKVVYSTEPPRTPLESTEPAAPGKRQTPGSTPFVPSAAGLILAGAVVQDLTQAW
jgi:tRNA A37 threonylcarbamoyladenosine dehydratase